jgi:hypothetical protein
MSGAAAMATDGGARLVGGFHDSSLYDDRFRIAAFAGIGEFHLSTTAWPATGAVLSLDRESLLGGGATQLPTSRRSSACVAGPLVDDEPAVELGRDRHIRASLSKLASAPAIREALFTF